MKEFESLLEFAEFLTMRALAEYEALHHGLKAVAKHIERVAKDEFGVYQPEVGPFPEWEELADSTKEDRLRQGYDPDEPLLRTGALRDSISHEVDGLEAEIGSDSDIMVYHEFGTEKIPPRPVLGPAAYRSKKQIEALVGAAVVSGMVGQSVLPAQLGYDADIKKES